MGLLLLALALALVPVDAAANAPATFELLWEAPSECPDRARVRTAIEHYLGRPVDASASEPLRVDALVERATGQGWRLTLEIETASGRRTRSIDGQTCEQLADTTALIVVITIDPTVGEQLGALEAGAGTETMPADDTSPQREPTWRTPSRESPPTENQRAAQDSAPAPVVRPPSTRERPRGSLQLGMGAGAGVLPGLSPNLRLATGLLWKWSRLDATGEFWFDKSRGLENRPDAGGEFRLWSLGLRACGVPSVSRVEFPLCGGVEVGAMTGVGTGISDPQTERLAWVVASGEAMVVYAPLRRIALWLGARLRIPLARPSFAIEGLGTVHAAAPVGVDAALGVELRFP